MRASSITGRMRRFFSSISRSASAAVESGRTLKMRRCITSEIFGRNVGDEFRRGHAKRVQHKINPVIGVAAARRHGLGHAGAALEFRVADGGANRVGVRVPMADDKNFTHAKRRRLIAPARSGKQKASPELAKRIV